MTTPDEPTAKPALPEPDLYLPPARHASCCALYDPTPGHCDCGVRGTPLWGEAKVRAALEAAAPAPDDTAKLLRASVEMERLRKVLAAAKALVDRDLRYISGWLDTGLIKREEVLALRDAIASAEEARAALAKAQGGAAC